MMFFCLDASVRDAGKWQAARTTRLSIVISIAFPARTSWAGTHHVTSGGGGVAQRPPAPLSVTNGMEHPAFCRASSCWCWCFSRFGSALALVHRCNVRGAKRVVRLAYRHSGRPPQKMHSWHVQWLSLRTQPRLLFPSSFPLFIYICFFCCRRATSRDPSATRRWGFHTELNPDFFPVVVPLFFYFYFFSCRRATSRDPSATRRWGRRARPCG